MTTSDRPSAAIEAVDPGVAVVVVLSGSRRGATVWLAGERVTLGTAADAGLRFRSEVDPEVAPEHAVLRRRGQTWEVIAEEGQRLWVNGEEIESMVLASGDLVEVGRGGPVVRFRIYPPGTPSYKTVSEVFADCRDCARYGGQGGLGRAAVMLAGVPVELATQTSRRFRRAILATLLIIALALGALFWQSLQLEQRVETGADRLTGISALLERSESLTSEDLRLLRRQVDAQTERLTALEARSEAAARVIERASRAVVFLQASFGFFEPGSGRPLRFAVDARGRPVPGPGGEPVVTVEGDGPIVESLLTGTAFVAHREDLLITNRHVAEPWRFDQAARALAAQGLEARMRRFVGYLPGAEEPFTVQTVAVGDDADVAVLRCSGATTRVEPLELRGDAARPGEDVVILGYPAGIRALLARTDPKALEQILAGDEVDFWSVARRLSGGGLIRPLASRGIVGQVSAAAVVYDAETTQGGSGGPVLDLDARVVAVNAAVLPEFGGSNLGVPASRARPLLERAAAPAPAEAEANPP